jgi:hypothetical protein
MDAQFVSRREFLLRHRRLLRDWARAFGGAQTLRAVPFLESDKSSPALLPARLLAAAGLPHEQVAGWPTPAGIRNASLSATAVELLRVLNPQLEFSPLRPVSSRRQMVELVGARFPGPAPLLTPEAAEALHDRRLVWTGLPRTAFATGRGWRAWSDQPAAACGPAPQLPPDLVDRIHAELLQEQAGDAILPAAAASPLRRLAIRVTRR